MLPLFPELRPLLLEAFEQAAPGTEYVITRCRDASANLRTHLQRIIRKAGLTPWPKLFHNLRASRQTELAEKYPIHVVCQWIGNSRAVAQEHYLQVTDAHFAQASAEPVMEQTPTNSAAQNPAQSTAVSVSKGREAAEAANENRPDLPSDSDQSRYLLNSQVGAVGTETARNPLEKLDIHQPGGAKNGAVRGNDLSELAELVALWPHLAAPVRNALIQLARSARQSRQQIQPPARREQLRVGDSARPNGKLFRNRPFNGKS